jgi:predicted ribosomally synthesized peptide with SipW-like signal peptide
MLTKKSLPVGTLFMVLVILLALLGVGYAVWSETLTISGTVQTGEVDVRFSTYPKEECVDINGVLNCPEPEEKASAANCSIQWSGPDNDSNGDEGYDQLLVTVNGIYPSWHCKVSFDVTNIGNVPVHVKLPEPTDDIPEWVATDFDTCYEENVQLHQGQSTGKCTIDIHFTNDQAPPEDSGPYTFGWNILAHQYNECVPSFVATGDPYDGLYGSTVIPGTATFTDCSSANVLRIESTQNFQAGQDEGHGAGWAGWSCIETGYPHVVGGGVIPPDADVYAQGPAKPGADPIDGFNYPIYPHYTYTSPEEGWVVEAAGATPPTGIYALCAP